MLKFSKKNVIIIVQCLLNGEDAKMVYNKSITATVYIINSNRVLLHMHKKYNTWFPVGGHVEIDEFPHQAAIREAKEEAGLDIRLVKTEFAPDINTARVERIPSPFCIYRENGKDDDDFFDFIYIATSDTELLSPEEGESKVFKWFSLEELLEYDIKPHIKNTAAEIIKYQLSVHQ